MRICLGIMLICEFVFNLNLIGVLNLKRDYKMFGYGCDLF